MRIGHVVPTEVPVMHPEGGALQRRVRELAAVQESVGHDVFIFSPNETAIREVYDAGPTLIPVPLRLHRPLADYEYLVRVASGARRLRLDVIHAHGAPEAARILRSVAPVIVQTVDFFRYRGTSKPPVRAYFRRSLDRFDALLPVSEYCAHELEAFYPGLRPPISVVPNGVNVEDFADSASRRERARSALGLPSHRFCLYLGRVCEQKGSDMLPGLAMRLREIGASLVVAGPAERFGISGETSLITQIRDSGATYLGPVAEELLPGLLACAELLVLPTRRDEMFGMVLIEAGAAGTPAVASTNGGIPEAMGDAGVLFPVGDQAALEAAVLTTLSSPDMLPDLGERALVNASRFSWPSIAQQYERVYRDCLRA